MRACKALSTSLMPNEKLKLEDGAKKVNPTVYRSLVGRLLYLAAMRPNIMFAASLLSRYINSQSYLCLTAAKQVLRYIKSTKDWHMVQAN